MLRDQDRLIQHYRSLFAFIDWDQIPLRSPHLPGPHPHPESAYITHLRTFLLEHPLLVLELGFDPVLDPDAPFGFDVECTVPGDRWLRHKQQTLSPDSLWLLLTQTVRKLLDEIPWIGRNGGH